MKTKKTNSFLDLAHDLCGSIKGPKDLSTNKKYLKDFGIDFSDIPQLDLTQLGEPLIGKFYRPIKKQMSIRLDADVLEWFKSKSKKYQSLINKICRDYYIKNKNSD